jgi:hypothetical protein
MAIVGFRDVRIDLCGASDDLKLSGFGRPDRCSRNSYVDDNSYLLVSSLPSLFYTMSSHRYIYRYEC